MTYQVGDLIDFTVDDPVFEDEEAAYFYAYQRSAESDELLIGIWTGQEDGSELLAIIYHGVEYRA